MNWTFAGIDHTNQPRALRAHWEPGDGYWHHVASDVVAGDTIRDHRGRTIDVDRVVTSTDGSVTILDGTNQTTGARATVITTPARAIAIAV